MNTLANNPKLEFMYLTKVMLGMLTFSLDPINPYTLTKTSDAQTTKRNYEKVEREEGRRWQKLYIQSQNDISKVRLLILKYFCLKA